MLLFTYIQVDEFEYCTTINSRTLSLPNGNEVFVIWQWLWSDCDPETMSASDSDDDSISVIPETPPDEMEFLPNDDNDDDVVGSITPDEMEHTVTFKCIGCTREQKYQDTLAMVAHLRRTGNAVEVRVEPEPTNPVDARAIAFQCKVDATWKTIGYVVSEVLDDVHLAISTNSIKEVGFEWVKFAIIWRTPGWYAGVNITRRGEWSRHVLTSQSAKM